MKKYLLVLITLVALSTSSSSAQAVWGVRIGFSMPLVSGMNKEGLLRVEGKFGLELGPVLYYHLQNNWYINTGAMFSIKQIDFNDYYDGTYYKLSMYYLDIPMYAGYSFPVGKVSLFVQAGPSVGFQLPASDSNGFNSINAGIGFMAGVNLERFKIELGSQQELTSKAQPLNSLFIGVSYIF